MGRKSQVDLLPDELRIKLIELLKNPATTQADIAKEINTQAGEEVLSKSSVNRYASRMRKQIEKARQAREIADAYMERMGEDKQRRNQMGKVVNEQIRLMSFDLLGEIEELKEEGEIDPKLVIDLVWKVSRAVKELEQAEKLNAERESRIRKEAMEEAAEVAESHLKKEGIEDQTISTVKKAIFSL